jgi:fatty acid desaturase
MMAAHTNAVENLIVFAPLVLAARALSIATAVTAFACALYFWSRLAHVVVFTLGIPVLRTLSVHRRLCGAGAVRACDLQTDLTFRSQPRFLQFAVTETAQSVRARWFPVGRA